MAAEMTAHELAEVAATLAAAAETATPDKAARLNDEAALARTSLDGLLRSALDGHGASQSDVDAGVRHIADELIRDAAALQRAGGAL